jgi:hypothetical protein
MECGDLSPLSFAAERLFFGTARQEKSHSAAEKSGDKSPHSKFAGTKLVPRTVATGPKGF